MQGSFEKTWLGEFPDVRERSCQRSEKVGLVMREETARSPLGILLHLSPVGPGIGCIADACMVMRSVRGRRRDPSSRAIARSFAVLYPNGAETTAASSSLEVASSEASTSELHSSTQNYGDSEWGFDLRKHGNHSGTYGATARSWKQRSRLLHTSCSMSTVSN